MNRSISLGFNMTTDFLSIFACCVNNGKTILGLWVMVKDRVSIYPKNITATLIRKVICLTVYTCIHIY